MKGTVFFAWLALQANGSGALASSLFGRSTSSSYSAVHHPDSQITKRPTLSSRPYASSVERRSLTRLTTAAAGKEGFDVNGEPLETLSEQQQSVSRGGATQQDADDIPEEQQDTPNSITERIPPEPTLSQYIKFALPCLGLWIAGPLLSLVDTSFIGLSGSPETSAQQLAALGPATTFMDGATYLFAFLNVATTNLYSSARAASEHLDDKIEGPDLEAESVVRTATRVSVRCGVGLMIFLLAVCKPLLRLYIGDEAANTPGLLKSSSDYVMIRALHMPTSLLLGVLQSALLGAKDSVTPLIAILYSTVINVSGDYILVNRLKMGLPGAAIATTLAQWAATAALLGPARKELVHDRNLGILGKPKDDRYEPKGDSSSAVVITSKSFLKFAGPVLVLILGKLAAFGFMTNAAAGVPGQPTPLAAHQIILSLLFFCSPFLEVISQTAQTFLPPFLAPVRNFLERNKLSEDEAPKSVLAPWKAASHKVSTTLLTLSFLSAAGIASIVSLVPAFFGGILTSDTTVQQAVKPLAKYLWLGAFAWAPVAVGEGVLLAQRQLGFLAVIYLLSTAMLPPALLFIKLRKGSVGQVWLAFGIFQIFRALCFTGRIWWGPFLLRLFKREKKDEEMVAKAA